MDRLRYLPERSGRNKVSAHRGQSLVVAVIVMFILLFVGGIFVAIVARNLTNSGRAKDTIRAFQLAVAGIQHCDNFLMNSPEGADWRPAPDKIVNNQDPDRLWLQGGDWTRIQLTDGRALVRVTYQPQYIPDPADPLGQRMILDPLSRRIKIESIGRPGFLDPNDPTTFLNTPAPRLRRELVAYKSIGITDYMFYVTNRWNDTKAQADIGVPTVSVRKPTGYAGTEYPLGMQFGMPQRRFGAVAGTYFDPGGPIYANCHLNLIGNVLFGLHPSNGEGIFSSNKITVEANDPASPPMLRNMLTGINGQIYRTDDPQFTTFMGLLRDGSASPDANGFTRSITRLVPPTIDLVDPSSGLTRYRLSTRNSGPILNGINTGQVGMGSGMYINNFNNRDEESGKTTNLRSLWLNPYVNNGQKTTGWNGPYFIPQGVFLDFGYPVVQARDPNTSDLVPNSFVATPGVRVVRDPNDEHFRDPAGRFASTAEVDFTFFIYKPVGQRPVIKLESEFHRSALRSAPFNMTEKQIDRFLPAFNGVIYAEGNARVRGLMPSKANIQIRRENAGEQNAPTDADIYAMVNSPSVTVVSGDNIYIEGSLIRESLDSMIGLLAQNYVVVNTTMFVAENKGPRWEVRSGDQSGEPGYFTTITQAEAVSTPAFTLDFLHGDNPGSYVDTNGAAMVQYLMLYHGVPGNPNGGAATYMNLFVNDWYSRLANSPRYLFRPPNLPTDPGDYFQIRTEGTDDSFRRDVFPLFPKPNGSNYLYTGDPAYFFPQGLRDTFRPAVDPNFTQTAGSQDYLFSRAAVVPSDIRIEALMYAQNGSFFIIPGIPFNDDPSDTVEAALERATQLGLPAGSMVRTPGTHDMVPFYREPIDMRLTIVGAIAQNKTASQGDQAAWMQMWGWIPEVYGSTGKNPPNPANEVLVPRQHQQVDEVGLNSGDQRTNDEKAARITRGIRYLYDPALITPYQTYNPAAAAFRRDDAYFDATTNNILPGHSDVGRTLPPLPRLPCCPGFVYYGEVR